jgi:hypothetical protein
VLSFTDSYRHLTPFQRSYYASFMKPMVIFETMLFGYKTVSDEGIIRTSYQDGIVRLSTEITSGTCNVEDVLDFYHDIITFRYAGWYYRYTCRVKSVSPIHHVVLLFPQAVTNYSLKDDYILTNLKARYITNGRFYIDNKDRTVITAHTYRLLRGLTTAKYGHRALSADSDHGDFYSGHDYFERSKEPHRFVSDKIVNSISEVHDGLVENTGPVLSAHPATIRHPPDAEPKGSTKVIAPIGAVSLPVKSPHAKLHAIISRYISLMGPIRQDVATHSKLVGKFCKLFEGIKLKKLRIQDIDPRYHEARRPKNLFRVSMFVKAESYPDPKDPRVISAVEPYLVAHLLCYIKPLSDYLAKSNRFSWYFPGRKDKQLLRKAVAAIDYSRFDGRTPMYLNLMCLRILLFCYPDDYEDIVKLFGHELFGYFSAGDKRHPANCPTFGARLSGSACTTLFNTLVNAFIQYSANGEIGPCYGDDALVTKFNHILSIRRTAELYGMVVTEEPRDYGFLPFLGGVVIGDSIVRAFPRFTNKLFIAFSNETLKKAYLNKLAGFFKPDGTSNPVFTPIGKWAIRHGGKSKINKWKFTYDFDDTAMSYYSHYVSQETLEQLSKMPSLTYEAGVELLKGVFKVKNTIKPSKYVETFDGSGTISRPTSRHSVDVATLIGSIRQWHTYPTFNKFCKLMGYSPKQIVHSRIVQCERFLRHPIVRSMVAIDTKQLRLLCQNDQKAKRVKAPKRSKRLRTSRASE